MKSKDQLLKRKEELKAEMKQLDVELEQQTLLEEIEELDEITNTLNSTFQNETLEKHCSEEAATLYDVMQVIDKKVRNLRSELEEDNF